MVMKAWVFMYAHMGEEGREKRMEDWLVKLYKSSSCTCERYRRKGNFCHSVVPALISDEVSQFIWTLEPGI